MSLVEFARQELETAGLFSTDSDFGGMVGEAVIKMIENFADEGHSGASAVETIEVFARLARFIPLSPLTGADAEWNDISEMSGRPTWQNRRSPRVFKDEDGRAYDIDAVIFREPSGLCFTGRDSRRYVEFPYSPKSEYVDVPASDG